MTMNKKKVIFVTEKLIMGGVGKIFIRMDKDFSTIYGDYSGSDASRRRIRN